GPIARLDFRAADEGRSAISSSSRLSSADQSSIATACHARHTAGPSMRPMVSSRHTSIHARRSSTVATPPSLVADSSPSEYANDPRGNDESHRCSSATFTILPTLLPSFLPSCLPSYRPAFLPTVLPSFLPSC